MLLTSKYLPKTLAEVIGNEDAKQELLKWALEADKGQKVKPVMLSGPPGSGKTVLVRALALHMGWETVESDASRLRSATEIKEVLGAAAGYGSLWGTRRLVIIDEIGTTSDRGSVAAFAALAREASQPIVFIANDAWDRTLSPLRLLTKPVELKKVNSRTIAAFLKRVAKAEGLAEGEYLDKIAAGSSGDVRAALIDLQSLAGFESETAGVRERESGMFEVVRKVLKAETYADALAAGEGVDEEISMIIAWLAENVPNEYEQPEEVFRAFEALARADRFLGDVVRSRSYSFWRYARVLALAGAALAKEKKYYKFARYGFPSKMSRLSSSRGVRTSLKEAAKKVGSKTHASIRRSRRDTLPFLAQDESVAAYYGFEKDEAESIEEAYGKFGGKKAKKAAV